MHRIYFDANSGTVEYGFFLTFNKSKEELSAMGEVLAEGVHVIIYDLEEFEVEAVLYFDRDNDVWKAVPLPGVMG